jgi:ABC-type Zn2+ transport system substrate-binding protein/surface adhesin
MKNEEKHHEPGDEHPHDHKHDEHGEHHHKSEEKYLYFVDGVEYESHEEHITGAIIIAKLPEAKRGYALFLEGHGKQRDELIKPETSITLEKHHPKRFYTVPPASFGLV